MTAFGAPLPLRTQQRIALPFLICTLVWGSTWFVIGSQLHYVPGAWSIVYRFGLAGIAMFIVAASMRLRIALPAAGHGLAIIVGLTQFTLNYCFVYAAEERIASGLVALVSALLIVPNALFARAFLGQSVSRRFLVGSAVAIAGIALLFVDEIGRSSGDPHRILVGVLLSVAGLLAASVANVLQATQQARSLPPPSLLAWGMVYGTAIDLVVQSRSSDELAVTGSAALGLDLGGQNQESGWFRFELEGGRRELVGGGLGATTAAFAGGTAFTLTPEERTSGWVGKLRAVGGNAAFRFGGEFNAEEQQGRAALSLRASLQIGL